MGSFGSKSTTDVSTARPTRQLRLLDCICVVVGIVIGAGIFETTPRVVAAVGDLRWLIFVWLIGGVVALLGALCYAELTTTFPTSGGDYVFLTRAYGRPCGMLFAWCEFWIIRPGNIGLLAYVFARYAQQVFPLPLGAHAKSAYAIGAVLSLSALNGLGARPGVRTQNALTVIKIIGLVLVIVAALIVAASSQAAPSTTTSLATSTPSGSGIYIAMIMVLLTYGGWSEMSYVAAEIRDPEKNILKALLYGTSAVVIIYLMFNLSCWWALGPERLAESPAVAAEIVSEIMGDAGGLFVSVLVALSCLGAMNGMLFTGSRIYFAMGSEHRAFSWIGAWSSRRDAPVRSLVLQMIVTIGLIATFGSDDSSFERLVVFTTPVFWFFACLIAVSVMLLRRRGDIDNPRVFRVWFYPLPPLVLAATSLLMLYASLAWAWQNAAWEFLWTVAVVLAGLGIVCWERKQAI